jgi:hypothetical protein
VRTDSTSACSSSARPGATGSGHAQTAKTIGKPVRSSHRRPRSWCGVGSSNALFSAASPISNFASASSPSGTCSASGSSTFVRTTEVALSGVTATVRTCSSGLRATSWIESTAPSEETQSRGSRRRWSAWRAYSIDEIGATSSSLRRSRSFRSVGTPWTSSTSASSR